MAHDSSIDDLLDDTAETWLFMRGLKNRRENTLAIYRRDTLRFQKFVNRPLLEVTRLDAMRFVASLRTTLAPSSVAMIVRSVRTFYSWCIEEKLLTENPFSKLEPSVDPELPHIPTEDEITTVLRRAAKAKSKRDSAVMTMLVDTGCRKHEIAALTSSNVNLASGVVSFPVSKTDPRVVPLTDRAHRALGVWMRSRPDHEDSLWSVKSPYTLIRAITDRHTDKMFSPHDFRRAFAVQWLTKGGSEIGLMRIAGWSSRDMIRLYTEVRAMELASTEMRRLFKRP